MLKIKGVIEGLGAMLFILGLAGLAGACEGQGSFMVSAIVFSVGFGSCLWGFTR